MSSLSLILFISVIIQSMVHSDSSICTTYNNCQDCITEIPSHNCAWSTLNFCFNSTAPESNKTDRNHSIIHSVSNCPSRLDSKCWSYTSCWSCLQQSYGKDCAWSEWNYCFPAGKQYNGKYIDSESQCASFTTSRAVHPSAIIIPVVSAFCIVCCIVGCCLKRKRYKSNSYETVDKVEEDDPDDIAVTTDILECEPQRPVVPYAHQPQIEQQQLIIEPVENPSQIVYVQAQPSESMMHQEGMVDAGDVVIAPVQNL